MSPEHDERVSDEPPALDHDRRGSGEPLVLLHGLGSHWPMWRPVLDRLAAEREVVSVSLPGFGCSAPLPDGVEPSPQALADAVAAFAVGLGLERPHVAGNSLGGWVALELAKGGRARSATGLSPAGFWLSRRERGFSDQSLINLRSAARAMRGVAPRIARTGVGRRAASWQVMAHGDRVPPDALVEDLANLAEAPGFDATREAMVERRFQPGPIDVPVTVAWAEKDRLLLPRDAGRARRLLPRAVHLTLHGCGHVPTWDDPDQVARVLLEGSSRGG
jgi:pimeloyl-ACP methyl ester carboxylesterase